MAYEYDFFLSFPRTCSAGDWVVNHFRPMLQACFEDECQHAPSIYCYTEKENAVIWPLELQHALAHSKFLISILTPPYFYKSAWCRAELQTMVEREKIVGWGTVDNPRSLVYPVLYSGEHTLPSEIKKVRGPYDLAKFAIPDLQFRDAGGYIEFRERMREIAKELDDIQKTAPKWNAKWPIVTPDKLTAPSPPPPIFPAL